MVATRTGPEADPATFKPEYDRLGELRAFDETKAGVKGLVDAGITAIPRIFYRKSVGHKESSVSGDARLSIPVIDLGGVMAKDSAQRKEIVERVREATETWGFFQIVNHGISESVLEEMKDGVRRFHEQDTEVKKKYYTRELMKPVIYNSNFDLYSAPTTNWRDSFLCRVAPHSPKRLATSLQIISTNGKSPLSQQAKQATTVTRKMENNSNNVDTTAENTTVGQVPSASVARVPTSTVPVSVPVIHGEKPEKFSGMNFKRWQQKMLFYLTTLNLARFLTEEAPKLKEDELDVQVISAIEAWKHSDFLCRNYVLNGLADSLYNVYSTKKTAKELWESLDCKYKSEDAGHKEFMVGRFLVYKMVDSKTVISQVQEFQVIIHEIHSEGMIISESFQVASIIEKLPPAWKDFKNYLKHKRKEMNVEELIVRLRIEEDNRGSEKKYNMDMAKKMW